VRPQKSLPFAGLHFFTQYHQRRQEPIPKFGINATEPAPCSPKHPANSFFKLIDMHAAVIENRVGTN
jgi:hypothetical protein